MHKTKKYSEETKKNLKSVVDHFRLEDVAVRQRQLRTWRRLKLFWENFQNVWFDSVAHDWRVFDEVLDSQSNQGNYDKKVNVFRAYLESIIAALSVTVPQIKCYPDDADDSLDLSTAKAGDKIAQLIFRHNDLSLVWLHGLFVFVTEGMVAGYNYSCEDKEYGEYIEEKWQDFTGTNEINSCPNCNHQLDSRELTVDEAAIPLPSIQPQMPNELVEGMDIPNPEMEQEINHDEFMPGELCPSCNSLMNPVTTRESFTVTRLVGETSLPKSRVKIECYGGLNIKVPNYARTQSECLYLGYFYETHYTNAIEKFSDLKDTKLVDKLKRDPSGPYDTYEQWARLSPQYQGEYPLNNVTIGQWWLRPAAFNVLDEEDTKDLKKKFPNGVKVCLVNDEFADCCEEALDDHWTLSYNPLADYVHYDPLGMLAVAVQEITSDIISLTTQTIEHGIGQTFADPGVLDFNGYQQSEALPGGIFPAKPKSGKSLGDAFHEVKTATLSGEVLPFLTTVQQLGQVATGAQPSLFGGQLEGSGTASEYSMSRAQSLQRLQNTWKMLCAWWKSINGKAIPMYMKMIKTDEKDVQRKEDGSFINVYIRKAEIEGKIGKIELEANENLPITWSQRKDIVMQLLLSQNPDLVKIILAPENLDIIKEAIGLNDIYVPGEDDREAEYDEIKQLLQTAPMPNPITEEEIISLAEQGQPPPEEEVPSINIEMDIDNHAVRFDIIRGFLVSEAGRQAKVDNPDGYRNVLLHAKLHLVQIQMQMMAQAQEQGSNGEGGSPEKPKQGNSKKSAPITGDSDVQSTP